MNGEPGIGNRKGVAYAGSVGEHTARVSLDAAIDLYWLPLGAGGHFVRLNGRLYEALASARDHRKRQDLYHSALDVHIDRERYVIEMAPVWNERSEERGTVSQGAVGSRILGRWRMFQYEIRCWRNGRIPDVDEAIDSPHRLSADRTLTRSILDLVPSVPTPVWGRDELHAGEMWNSNSVISWLIARLGLHAEHISPPLGGRAPGWSAGIAIAQRMTSTSIACPPNERAG